MSDAAAFATGWFLGMTVTGLGVYVAVRVLARRWGE